MKIIKRTLGLFVLNLVLYSPSIILGTGNYVFLIKMFLLFLSLITYASTTSVYDFLTKLRTNNPNVRFIIFTNVLFDTRKSKVIAYIPIIQITYLL